MIMRLLRKLSAKAIPKKDDPTSGGDEGDDQLDEDDDATLAKALNALDQCMVTDAEPGIDDHADTVINPIVMYQIKCVKDEMRRKQLLEMMAAQEAGEEVPIQKTGLLKVLYDKGALNWLGKRIAAGGEAARQQEVKEKLKKIDAHLSTLHEINVARAVARPKQRVPAGSKKVHTALSKANELKWHPLEVQGVLKEGQVFEYAKRGRARVHPPLDHSIAAAGVRRASCGGGGGGRRATVARPAGGGRVPKPTDEAEDGVANGLAA